MIRFLARTHVVSAAAALIVVGIAMLVMNGYSTNRGGLCGDAIGTIDLAFNDPVNATNFEHRKSIPEAEWPAFLRYLSSKPYRGEVLKWESLADLRLGCTNGEVVVLRVLFTKQDAGVYEYNGRYYACDEPSLLIAMRECMANGESVDGRGE